MIQTYIGNVCLSVTVVVYFLLLKISYIILDDKFSIFLQAGNTALCLKNITKILHIFTKLSQNVCIINVHILIYRHASCGCKLWRAHCLYHIFFFFQIIVDHSWLKCCIFTKLSQTLWLIYIHILNVNIPDVSARYGRLYELNAFFGNLQILLYV